MLHVGAFRFLFAEMQCLIENNYFLICGARSNKNATSLQSHLGTSLYGYLTVMPPKGHLAILSCNVTVMLPTGH